MKYLENNMENANSNKNQNKAPASLEHMLWRLMLLEAIKIQKNKR